MRTCIVLLILFTTVFVIPDNSSVFSSSRYLYSLPQRHITLNGVTNKTLYIVNESNAVIELGNVTFNSCPAIVIYNSTNITLINSVFYIGCSLRYYTTLH